MVLCWSAAASVHCRGDIVRLSDAFTSVDVYIPKSSAPFPNISGAAVSTLFKWSWFRKKAALWCDPVQPCFFLSVMGKWCSPTCRRSFWIWGRNVLLSAVTHTFSDSFRRQWACDKLKGIARQRTLWIWKPEAPFLLLPSLAVAWWKWYFTTHRFSSHPENSSSISVT